MDELLKLLSQAIKFPVCSVKMLTEMCRVYDGEYDLERNTIYYDGESVEIFTKDELKEIYDAYAVEEDYPTFGHWLKEASGKNGALELVW